jgi:hypothetical protein
VVHRKSSLLHMPGPEVFMCGLPLPLASRWSAAPLTRDLNQVLLEASWFLRFDNGPKAKRESGRSLARPELPPQL